MTTMSSSKTLKNGRATSFVMQKSSSNYNSNTNNNVDPHNQKLPQKITTDDQDAVNGFPPTSPQLMYGEEILHFSHPQHRLSKLNLPDLFTCSGCKEPGAGIRFSCPRCDFQLHDFCALPPPSLNNHPFHFQHQLVFYSKPVKGGKCDACSKGIKGYGYRCSACSFMIHPSCSLLTSQLHSSSLHPHPLLLLPSSDPTTPTSFVCGECQRKRSGGRVYHCTVCDYHLHALCAKNLKNGLRANGIKPRDKPSMLGTAVRLASHVVVEFIGGIIEGLGEGVGDVLVQNIARGRHNNNIVPNTRRN